MEKKTFTIGELKRKNRNLIYRTIFCADQHITCKQEVASTLKLSLPTVSSCLNELSTKKLILEIGRMESTGGRKARALSINENAKYAIGLDLTRNHVSIVLINLRGNIISNRRFRLLFSESHSYYDELCCLINRQVNKTHILSTDILGVGIAVPAIISMDGNKMTYSALLDYTSACLEDFKSCIPFDCRLFNDASSGCFAELWTYNMTNQGNRNSLFFLSLNNSVGGAFMANQNIYYGDDNRAGEFGHTTLIPNGKKCYCGQYGCVDAYLSAQVLFQETDGNLEDFFLQLKMGNCTYDKIWNEYFDNLVLTLNNLNMIFNCDVIIGGYVGTYLEPYLSELQSRLAKKNTFTASGQYAKTCYYKDDSTAVGAALMYISEFIESI